MKVGILGLEYSGRKTLFSLLTGINGPGQGGGTAIGVVDVPDGRVDHLVNKYSSAKKTLSKIEFTLLAPVKPGSEDNRTALAEARETDMFAVVVREFADESVYHPLGGVDVARDYSTVKDEIIFADLYLVETRLERIDKQLKSQKNDQVLREKDVLLKFHAALEAGQFLNTVELTPSEAQIVRSLSFLTLKPIFVVVNCGESSVAAEFSFPNGVKSITVSAKIEREIQQLEAAARAEFLEALGLTEAPLARLIRFAYAYGRLMSFLTAGADESRAWTIRQGSTAQTAAGAIHSDIEKGFIRAEVVGFDDFVAAGSEAEARRRGLYRLEGKEYIVKDGDIMEFRFNVSK